MKYLITLLAASFALIAFNFLKPEKMIASNAFDWKIIGLEQQSYSESKQVLTGPSDGFKNLTISIVNIDVNDKFVIAETKTGPESLVIIKSGTTHQVTGEINKALGTGSVSLMMPGDELTITNVGQTVTTLYLLSWSIRDAENAETHTPFTSHLINWDDIEFVETGKGGRRNIIREPTSMLREFEMHVTTLKEGMRSHLPHTHIDEEVILVRHGDVEEHIDGELHEVGAGSFIFLRSMIPHGIRNIGTGEAEYYAFKWAPR